MWVNQNGIEVTRNFRGAKLFDKEMNWRACEKTYKGEIKLGKGMAIEDHNPTHKHVEYEDYYNYYYSVSVIKNYVSGPLLIHFRIICICQNSIPTFP